MRVRHPAQPRPVGRGQRVDHELADAGDVTRRGLHDLVLAGLGEHSIGRSPVCGAGHLADQAAALQAGDDPGEAGRVALVRVASSVIRRVRCGASDSMARQKYSKWVAAVPVELRVQGGRQQLEYGDEAKLSGSLIGGQPPWLGHASSLPLLHLQLTSDMI